MSIFTKPFFSVAGQIERLKNVGAVLNASFNPFSKTTVQANVGNPAVKTILQTAANHPYITAGLVAGGVTAGATKIINVAKSVGLAIATKYPLSTAAAVITSPVSVPFVYQLAKSEKIVNVISNAPKSSSQAGEDLVKLIDEPTLEKGIEYVKNHPALTIGALTTILLGLGYTTIMISQIMAQRGNTKALNNFADGKIDETTNPPLTSSPYGVAPNIVYNITTPSAPEVVASVPTLTAPSGTKPKKKAKKKPKKKAKKKTRRSKKKRKTIKRRKS